MDVEIARRLLHEATGDEEPVTLPASILSSLSLADLPPDVAVQVGVIKDGVYHVEWSGELRREEDRIIGEADYTWTRKYWYEPLGLEQYLDLVRRAAETRQRTRGDVELGDYDDDGAYIHLRFSVHTSKTNLGEAYAEIKRTCDELEETAHQAADQVGKRIAEIAARVSGWGAEALDVLVDTVAKSTKTDEKGRALEELSSRLFETIPGFTVTGRVRTETEEIDISILNDSTDPRLRRESAVILAECKNWTSKCGKNEFVVFRQKMENRTRRCSLGFLISWNGFTETVTKEMLRGSRESLLVVPLTGAALRTGLRDNNFARILTQCWDEAVHL
jgi:hypothetical protein